MMAHRCISGRWQCQRQSCLPYYTLHDLAHWQPGHSSYLLLILTGMCHGHANQLTGEECLYSDFVAMVIAGSAWINIISSPRPAMMLQAMHDKRQHNRKLMQIKGSAYTQLDILLYSEFECAG